MPLDGMSDRNLESVRRLYDAWGRGDLPGPLELLHDDVEYVNPPGAIEPGTRSGVAEFARAGERVLEAWEFWEAEPQEMKAAGDRVAVLVRFRARGRGSGVEVEGYESALFRFRDGKVVRYEWFHGQTGAFEALD
jgi:ketosteroid isomerase-like protein